MSWDSTIIRKVNLKKEKEVAAISDFLARFQLRFDTIPDYTIALIKDDRIVGTGSLAGDVLRNLAVEGELQGEGLLATIVTELIREAGVRGIFHHFIYTKPSTAPLFTALGFSEIARADLASVLEGGISSIQNYLDNLKRETAALPMENRAALVVNCNPFTKGHLALVEKAAKEHNVIVFVVSEDRSLFPFADRLRLVSEGVRHLQNVVVVTGGKYIISAATFPAYFSREEDIVAAQTRLDATIFASRIAKALGITTRFVGEEPYCAVTATYNQAMAEVLPHYGIALQVIPRVEVAGEIISASKVRDAIRNDDKSLLEAMLPPTTLAFLNSDAALPVIAKIKATDSRH